MVLSERARVLITVKASPEPSEKYGDTVCVAGVRLDKETPEWIRLYPVPFRYMARDQQFHKYEVINVDLLPPQADKRRESYRIVLDSVSREKNLVKSIAARGAILEPLIGPTMCELNAGVVDDMNAQSLALVRPATVTQVSIVKAAPWTEAQQRKVNQSMSIQTLLGDETPAELRPPRFRASYEYTCESAACKGHNQGILDWELSALQLNLSKFDDATAMRKIKEKFLDELCGPTVRPHFFVGNIANPTRRRNFSVLGAYKPPRHSSYGETLFDF